jgi:hypothetical protein
MLAPNWYPDHKQLRQFALACLPGFAFAGFMLHLKGHSWSTVGQSQLFWDLSGIGAFLCFLGLAVPTAIRPVYVLLMGVTMPIGFVVSHMFLRVIFYLILTPLGLLFRMIGRDPLLLIRPSGDSYWQVRKQRTDPLSYYRQS